MRQGKVYYKDHLAGIITETNVGLTHPYFRFVTRINLKTTRMETEIKDGKPAIYAATRQEWRSWLEENSQTMKSVWLILYHKKSKVPCTSISDAVEEALCFGWIDSLAKKRDAESFYLTFTPRKPKSNWSKINIERAERLIRDGLMTESGLKLIEAAKGSGKWV